MKTILRTFVGLSLIHISYTSEPESGRWQEYPFALKAVGDKAFTEGISRMVIHRYAMQPDVYKRQDR